MFSGVWRESNTDQKEIFIDRDPYAFNHILRYLRNPKYILPCDVLYELDFYGIKYSAPHNTSQIVHVQQTDDFKTSEDSIICKISNESLKSPTVTKSHKVLAAHNKVVQDYNHLITYAYDTQDIMINHKTKQRDICLPRYSDNITKIYMLITFKKLTDSQINISYPHYSDIFQDEYLALLINGNVMNCTIKLLSILDHLAMRRHDPNSTVQLIKIPFITEHNPIMFESSHFTEYHLQFPSVNDKYIELIDNIKLRIVSRIVQRDNDRDKLVRSPYLIPTIQWFTYNHDFSKQEYKIEYKDTNTVILDTIIIDSNQPIENINVRLSDTDIIRIEGTTCRKENELCGVYVGQKNIYVIKTCLSNVKFYSTTLYIEYNNEVVDKQCTIHLRYKTALIHGYGCVAPY